MAATRLSDDQKQEIVARYREGASSSELAAAYGCSANTVSRVVKGGLEPEEYERLKQQRLRGGRAAVAVAPEATAVVAEAAAAAAAAPAEAQAETSDRPAPAAPAAGGTEARGADDDDDDGPGVLAIDDADDFADDADAEDDLEDEDEGGDESEAFVTVPVHLGAGVEELVECRALSEARLPDSAYLLVDRTVELQPLPLSDCPDLGPLPQEEAERQALLLFVNPRQAKRHCGRSQRVIKLPDVGLLERTAPYLLAQGISRVVIEGGLYSLPGS